ncbi:hypothetical protein PAT3040_03403 [Paenibacillus agaridevorans]|uniref:Uncharacterized protein n=1 Tax=Paenibacillus agaridevorans TaxID=171404 RepID=A0A2R5EQ36_9BACL|nr:hypothetical protein PAT3040_03403 [Paenibacillus agaridevorans]
MNAELLMVRGLFRFGDPLPAVIAADRLLKGSSPGGDQAASPLKERRDCSPGIFREERRMQIDERPGPRLAQRLGQFAGGDDFACPGK